LRDARGGQLAESMPSYGECQSAEIAAPPQACFDALTDFEHHLER
jgi:hypothetical protein